MGCLGVVTSRDWSMTVGELGVESASDKGWESAGETWGRVSDISLGVSDESIR